MHALLLIALATFPAAKVDRIDLVDFGQVVRFGDDAAMTAQPLDRGTDGWEAYSASPGSAPTSGAAAPAGTPEAMYIIGVQWETPRDIAEVNLEFRHAIANREKIQVQYYQEGWPAGDKTAKGHWQTAKIADWWAGDRDVSFVFTPYSEEQPGKGAPDVRFRQTRRLRFLIGKEAPPPVRYIRAYGPGKAAMASFELSSEAEAAKAVLTATVENGYIIQGASGGTTQSTLIETLPRVLSIRYAVVEANSPNRTLVKLQGEGSKRDQFAPAEVLKAGRVKLAAAGLTVTGAASQSKPAK
jgi:hypothetical protein